MHGDFFIFAIIEILAYRIFIVLRFEKYMQYVFVNYRRLYKLFKEVHYNGKRSNRKIGNQWFR